MHSLILVILTGILWILQTAEYTDDINAYSSVFLKYKVIWGACIIALQILLFWDKYRIAKNYKERVTKEVLRLVLSEKEVKKGTCARVTLYKTVTGWQLNWSLFWKYLFNMNKHKEKGNEKSHKYADCFKKYLKIQYRQGHPQNPESTSTFFIAAKRQENVDGFTSHVYLEGKDSVHLPNIKDIDLNIYDSLDSLSKSKRKDSELVRNYMKEGYIRCLDKLKAIHQRSINLWGTSLIDENGYRRGVFVIDDDNIENVSYNEDKFEICAQILDIINNNDF